jgi:Protein of unknown function (DUF4235)
MLAKIVFIPFSIVAGLLAGFVGKRLFERAWALIDSEEPPGPGHRETSWVKLIAALALEGAIFRAVRGAFDHGSRSSFARLTGIWPGERPAEPSDSG